MHNEGRVLVALLAQGVELCSTFSNVWLGKVDFPTSNSVVKCLLGEMASLIRRVEDLVVEDGKVQRETETDGVSRGEISSGNLRRSFVGLQRLISRDLALVTESEFREVAVVVALPVSTKSVRVGDCR